MNRAEKKEAVARLDQVFTDSGVVVVFHYAGLSVLEISELRARAREKGAAIYVAKNRLAKVALAGKECEGLAEFMSGQSALAYSDDPVSAPLVVVNFAKSNEKIAIIGGAMGANILSESDVKKLAATPPIEELRGKIVGLLQAPAAKIARTIAAPAGQLARLLSAHSNKQDTA